MTSDLRMTAAEIAHAIQHHAASGNYAICMTGLEAMIAVAEVSKAQALAAVLRLRVARLTPTTPARA